MKRLLFFYLFAVSLNIAAQPGSKIKDGSARERIKAQRTAFITDRLSLSPEESQKFWPVYNQFTEELEGLKKTQNKSRRNGINKLAFISDQEAEKILEEEIQIQQKIVDLQQKYQQELKKVISVKKILMLYQVERDFKMELLRKLGKAADRLSEQDDQ
jgi:hypothetical protein